MKLILPLRSEWNQRVTPEGIFVEPAPGVTLCIDEMRDLPHDLRRWGDLVVTANVPLERLRVREIEDVATEDGWPVTLVSSDLVDASTSWTEVRRVHALYRFLQFGVVAVVFGRPAQMDAQREELLNLLKQGRPDFATDEIIALSQLFADLPT